MIDDITTLSQKDVFNKGVLNDKEGFKNGETPLDENNLNALVKGIKANRASIDKILKEASTDDSLNELSNELNAIGTNLSNLSIEIDALESKDTTIIEKIWGGNTVPTNDDTIDNRINTLASDLTTNTNENVSAIANIEERLDVLSNSIADSVKINDIIDIIGGGAADADPVSFGVVR